MDGPLGGDERHQRRAWIPAALLLFGRPEAPAFAFALLLFLAPLRGGRAAVAKQVGLLLAIATVAEVARFLYFHDLVSQAFYLKAERTNLEPGRILWDFLRESNLLLLAAPILAVAWRPSFWTRERSLLAIMTGLLMGWAARTDDPGPYSRHFVPALPFFYILAVAAIDTLSVRLGRYRRAGRATAFALAWCLIALAPSVSFRRHDSEPNPIHDAVAKFASDPARYGKALVTELLDPATRTVLDDTLGAIEHNYQALIGKFIATNYSPDVVVVYDQMGQTPYYAGPDSTFIDSFGLTERPTGFYNFYHRARRSPLVRTYDSLASSLITWAFPEERRHFTHAQALDSIFDAQPDLVLVNRLVVETGGKSVTRMIRNDRRLRRDFVPRYLLAGWTELYERRGRPMAPPAVPEGLDVQPLRVDGVRATGRSRRAPD